MINKKVKLPTDAAPVVSYKHENRRVRIPTQEESVMLTARDKRPVKKRYSYDPSLDPQLVWAGKIEAGDELGISTVPIYVQEKIAPEAIIARLKAGVNENAQMAMFGETTQGQITKAIDFYKHEDNWQNRMVLGDSLLVMNSLLEKEGMRGKIQTIYIDPPYGIKFGSNWQVSTRKRDVKDNNLNDFVRQPEQVKAFRDTWELGIHSYLSYLRDRLIVARELLTESGNCFIQISDENVHLIRNVMDEIFGSENFISIITFKKSGGMGQKFIDNISDYLIWYSKDIGKCKFRPLYQAKYLNSGPGARYNQVELPDGSIRPIKSEEQHDPRLLPKGSRVFLGGPLTSQTPSESTTFEFELDGKKFKPSKGGWKTNYEGMMKLINKKRIFTTKGFVNFKLYFDDFPFVPISNLWSDTMGTAEQDKVYVVQTVKKVIERCILMTTDPGDIVLDPTCGSGTTAYVAEQWGRRWITIDTSRVALALARTRLMTSVYPYYKLNDKNNINMGFEYKTIPHVTLKSLANDEDPETEILYNQPYEDKEIIRVTGPLTIESLSPHRISDNEEMLTSERYVETVIENLLKAGIQTGEKTARVKFENLDILPGGPELQAVGEFRTNDGLKRVAVSIGPEFGSVDDDFIRDATYVANKFADLLVVAATSFDASAFSTETNIDGFQIMKVKINPDLSMGDLLKKTGSANLFLAFGEPDIVVKEEKEGYVVEIVGVDVYDPVKSEIRSSGSGNPEHDIAAWFIDTNYNSDAFFVTHAYFLGKDKPYDKLKKALRANINEEAWDELYSTISRPFPKPKTGKIALKVINHFGDEVMKVISIN